MDRDLSLDYIREYYGVPAEPGRRVEVYGKPGVIVSGVNAYIVVLLDSAKPTDTEPYHPTDGVRYLGMGKIRKMTPGQARYRKFKDADWFEGTFAEWLGID